MPATSCCLVHGSYRKYALQDFFFPVTGATASCDTRRVAKGVENPVLTAYVRFELIGDRKDVTAVAVELGQNKQWVINVRDGHRGVGAKAMQDLADRLFSGSLDKLRHAAERHAREHSERIAWVMADAAENRRERAIALVYEDTGTPVEVLRQWAETIKLPPEATTLDWVRALNDAAQPGPPRPVEPGVRRRAERDAPERRRAGPGST